ncbi:hypothetical protein L6Q85_13425 [bacterium]|nr:hypothetical protein [bacterium]
MTFEKLLQELETRGIRWAGYRILNEAGEAVDFHLCFVPEPPDLLLEIGNHKVAFRLLWESCRGKGRGLRLPPSPGLERLGPLWELLIENRGILFLDEHRREFGIRFRRKLDSAEVALEGSHLLRLFNQILWGHRRLLRAQGILFLAQETRIASKKFFSIKEPVAEKVHASKN